MDLCEAEERNRGIRVGMRWWEQVGLDLAGSSDTALMSVEAEKDRMD